MSAAPIEELITQAQATTELDILLPPTDLPYDDGEPFQHSPSTQSGTLR